MWLRPVYNWLVLLLLLLKTWDGVEDGAGAGDGAGAEDGAWCAGDLDADCDNVEGGGIGSSAEGGGRGLGAGYGAGTGLGTCDGAKGGGSGACGNVAV